MRIGLATLLASGLLVPSACGSDGNGEFTIVDVEYTTTVVSDGVRDPMRIHWSGDATFPVEFVTRLPNGCPANTTCENAMEEFVESENPLVRPGVWCAGTTEEVVFEYEFVLIDANGVSTEPYPIPFTCVPR